MRFILRDLKDSFKNNMGMYILIIVSQIIGIVCLMMVYGTYAGYDRKQKELNIEQKEIQVIFNNVNIGEIRNDLYEMLGGIEKDIDFIYLLTYYADRMINLHFEYHDGKYYMGEVLKGYLDEKYTESDKKVIVMGGKYEIGTYFEVEGEKIEVVGCSRSEFDTRTSWMWINHCPEKLDAMLIIFEFKELPTYKAYMHIKDFFDGKYAGRSEVDEFEVFDIETAISIRTMIFMSVAVGIVIALNTAFLYGYLIRKRRRDMALYSILGATRGRRFAIPAAEIGIVGFVTILAGIILFMKFIEPVVGRMYGISRDVFDINSYAVLGGVYYACIMAVMSIVIFVLSRTKIKVLLRRVNHD